MQANNNFTIVGNLTRDPEIRLTTKQTKYCFATVAVNGIGKDKPADFISVLLWENLADNLHKYCHKGDCIAFCGRIGTRKGEDGKKTEYTLTADSFSILRAPQRKQEAPAEQPVKPTGDVVAEAMRSAAPWNPIEANPYGVDFPQ
jgi:single-strand DNA-binding protein